MQGGALPPLKKNCHHFYYYLLLQLIQYHLHIVNVLMAELREAVATREETVVNDVATGMGYALKKDQKAIVLRFVKVKKC